LPIARPANMIEELNIGTLAARERGQACSSLEKAQNRSNSHAAVGGYGVHRDPADAWQNRRILVIDDTLGIHDDFRKILARPASQGSELYAVKNALFGDQAEPSPCDFELDSAYQGREGVAKVRDSLRVGEPYALAFVDMRMPPGWDGVETIEHLWREDPRLQVVICTAYSDHPWDEALRRLGGDDRLLVLKKPFDHVEVRQLAGALTQKWEMTQRAALKMTMLEETVARRTAELRKVNEDLRQEIAERERAEALRIEQGRVLEMIGTSSRLQDVLDRLVRLVEANIEGASGCVLLLDEDGRHLRRGAAPSLPKACADALDCMVIGPTLNSFAATLDRPEKISIADVVRDSLWSLHCELAAARGLRGCWSMPVLAHDGRELGAFAVCCRVRREPTEVERQLIDTTTHIAGIAIERKLAEDRIRYMAHHDALTGLANRTLLEDRLGQAVCYAQRYGRRVTVIFIDLDNFKLINDSLGHGAGDKLLKLVAERMARSVRQTDTVVRLGGDEFVIVLFDYPAEQQASDVLPVLERLRKAISEPVHIGDREFQVSCSMGLAFYPDHGQDVEALLKSADAAMYRAKELGRDNYQFYVGEMNAQAQQKLTLQEGLRSAVARQEFMLLYQPQVDIVSGRVIGVEALIRWRHPDLGILAPSEFIPVAEETRLIVPIGEWVISTACRQNKAWQKAGLPPVVISVNVSACQFRAKDMVRCVARALAESGLEAQYLELELTETLIMQNAQLAVATMRELKSMGVRLSIDDFGTGYSSLSALRTFPIARLKVDRSFVSDLQNQDEKALVGAIISLGHQLNLRVIAEGIETAGQLAFLRASRCDEAQGFYFCKPVAGRRDFGPTAETLADGGANPVVSQRFKFSP
jgi:diguanylate cyclase (GGDEF)-like protein